jgi:glycerophosphoryl diester phosphodiesterase
MGSHAIELDLQMSADGHVMVIHDATVDRTTDGTGRVMDMTLEELKALDVGYHFMSPDGGYPYRGKGVRIPTLAEVLERFPTTPLVLDIKTESGKAIVDAVAKAVAYHEAEDRVIAISFDTEFLRRFRHLMPEVPTSFGNSEVLTFFILHLIHLQRWYRPPAELLVVQEYHSRIRVVTSRFVRAAEHLGLEVHVWTINEKEDMRRLVHLGVDGMLTDYPDRLHSVLLQERFTAGGTDMP